MRITLAQWREREPKLSLDSCGSCSYIGREDRYLLCPYHRGFVDGFDAARGGE